MSFLTALAVVFIASTILACPPPPPHGQVPGKPQPGTKSKCVLTVLTKRLYGSSDQNRNVATSIRDSIKAVFRQYGYYPGTLGDVYEVKNSGGFLKIIYDLGSVSPYCTIAAPYLNIILSSSSMVTSSSTSCNC
ncbi:hypothetical protein AB6A40_010097 [Gnathostoma spinigerum]|uniref:Uncharacterized protein n=1 Tax=Gnathostoma spinigerum TaxID=75299 RepID=A0ABD6EUA2_9BILA